MSAFRLTCPFLMSPELTVFLPGSATAVPDNAASSATNATAIAGDGRRLKLRSMAIVNLRIGVARSTQRGSPQVVSIHPKGIGAGYGAGPPSSRLLDRGSELGIAARRRLLRALLALHCLEQRAHILRVRRRARGLAAAEAQQRRHVVFLAVPRRLARSSGVTLRPSVPVVAPAAALGPRPAPRDAGSRLRSRFRAGVGCYGRRACCRHRPRSRPRRRRESAPHEYWHAGQPHLRGRPSRRKRRRGSRGSSRGRSWVVEKRGIRWPSTSLSRVQGPTLPCPGEIRSSPTRRTETSDLDV